jgi:hypothetical protein
LVSSLNDLLQHSFERPPFLVKAIFFDKPTHSNWVVNWHQDLTIHVKDRIYANGFEKWNLLTRISR